MLADELREAEQHLLARGRGAARPVTGIEGAAGARDGGVHVRGIAGGDLRDGLAGRRIDAVEGRTRDGRLILAVDEGLRARSEGLRQFAPVDRFLFPVHGLLLKASVDSKR